MNVVVFEQDPLVREDICDTLVATFVGVSIQPCDTWEDARALLSDDQGPRMLVLSTPTGSDKRDLDQLLSAPNVQGSVVISNTSQKDSRSRENVFYIERPFGSALLTQAVKTVFLDLPERQ